MSEVLRARIRSPGPKRILSLDGGGIRGLITLGYLERIEAVLRENLSSLCLYRPPASPATFRLRDYYDLIGGTSTGAIISSALAIGKSVPEVIEIYLSLGKKIFATPFWEANPTRGILVSKFKAKPLQTILKSILGDTTLGDERITTGLCIVAKRHETNSTWVLTNAPDNLFYADANDPNGALSLAGLVRASAAAPSYFMPENIKLGFRPYSFIDGGISPHNNPALQLFIAATVANFGFSWPTGADRLSILSLGTGDWRRRQNAEAWQKKPPLLQAVGIIDMFMEDCSRVNETVLQAIGTGRNRRNIDALTGHLTGSEWGPSLLRYERLQVFLEDKFFVDNGLSKYVSRIKDYQKMDSTKHMLDLLEIGRILATRDIELATLI